MGRADEDQVLVGPEAVEHVDDLDVEALGLGAAEDRQAVTGHAGSDGIDRDRRRALLGDGAGGE